VSVNSPVFLNSKSREHREEKGFKVFILKIYLCGLQFLGIIHPTCTRRIERESSFLPENIVMSWFLNTLTQFKEVYMKVIVSGQTGSPLRKKLNRYHSSQYALLLTLFLSFGCAPFTLTMTPEFPPVDKSVAAQDFAKTKYAKIMVIPPQGVVRGEFDPKVAILERELLKKGVTIISAAVTGRVVLESVSKEEKGGRYAVDLSDVERALVMAKQTGADAILQIGLFKLDDNVNTRFFVRSENEKNYQEVRKQVFLSAENERKIPYKSSLYRFVGRLIDVQSGEVRITFDVENACNWNMPGQYVATIREKKGLHIIDSENYSYSNADWADICDMTLDKTILQLVKRIGEPAANTAGKQAATTSLESKPASEVSSKQTTTAARETRKLAE